MSYRGQEDIEFLRDLDPDLLFDFEEKAAEIEFKCDSDVVDRHEAERRAWLLVVVPVLKGEKKRGMH